MNDINLFSWIWLKSELGSIYITHSKEAVLKFYFLRIYFFLKGSVNPQWSDVYFISNKWIVTIISYIINLEIISRLPRMYEGFKNGDKIMQISGMWYLEFIMFHNGRPLLNNINVFDGKQMLNIKYEFAWFA